VSAQPHLRDLELFADCTDAELDRVSSLLTTVTVGLGGVLMHEGDPGDEVMIVGQGSASVSRLRDASDASAASARQIGVVSDGSVVGELSLLHQAPRSATVTALGPLTAFVCNRSQFEELLKLPGVGDRVAAIAARRLAANRMAAALVVPVVLADGTRLVIRPICPDDKTKLDQAMQALSAESRRRRFFTAKEGLNAASLAYLTELDFVGHFAWVALDEDEPERPIVGVARYIRLADQPEEAELALTVQDAYQGRGLGSLLLDALGVAARANGVERFVAHVLQENTPMRAMLRRAGGTFGIDEPGVLRTVIDIPGSATLEQAGTLAGISAAVAGVLSVDPAGWRPPAAEG
jgi:protein lysine acetyltransferase